MSFGLQFWCGLLHASPSYLGLGFQVEGWTWQMATTKIYRDDPPVGARRCPDDPRWWWDGTGYRQVSQADAERMMAFRDNVDESIRTGNLTEINDMPQKLFLRMEYETSDPLDTYAIKYMDEYIANACSEEQKREFQHYMLMMPHGKHCGELVRQKDQTKRDRVVRALNAAMFNHTASFAVKNYSRAGAILKFIIEMLTLRQLRELFTRCIISIFSDRQLESVVYTGICYVMNNEQLDQTTKYIKRVNEADKADTSCAGDD